MVEIGGTAALDVRDVRVTYPRKGGDFEAVRGVSFTLDDGEILALLGASGSGKSSLLRGIAGLETVSAGSVRVNGREMVGVPVHQRGIGLVFQDGQLFPHRNVGRNIAYGIEKLMSRTDVDRRVSELLELIGMSGFAERGVATLSGGQAQRVALARSLASRPEILLLDEPLSALDRALRESLSGELRDIIKEAEIASVYVTHDHEEAFTVADRVAVMVDGLITQIGTREDLLERPASPEVAAFFASKRRS